MALMDGSPCCRLAAWSWSQKYGGLSALVQRQCISLLELDSYGIICDASDELSEDSCRLAKGTTVQTKIAFATDVPQATQPVVGCLVG